MKGRSLLPLAALLAVAGWFLIQGLQEDARPRPASGSGGGRGEEALPERILSGSIVGAAARPGWQVTALAPDGRLAGEGFAHDNGAFRLALEVAGPVWVAAFRASRDEAGRRLHQQVRSDGPVEAGGEGVELRLRGPRLVLETSLDRELRVELRPGGEARPGDFWWNWFRERGRGGSGALRSGDPLVLEGLPPGSWRWTLLEGRETVAEGVFELPAEGELRLSLPLPPGD